MEDVGVGIFEFGATPPWRSGCDCSLCYNVGFSCLFRSREVSLCLHFTVFLLLYRFWTKLSTTCWVDVVNQLSCCLLF